MSCIGFAISVAIYRGAKCPTWKTANGSGKQGRGNQPPYRRYGPDTEIQYRPQKPHGPAKSSRILSKREDGIFQYGPHIVDTDTIADAVFADAISETSGKGCRVRHNKTAEKQPEEQLKNPENRPTQHPFWLFSMSGIWHLCRWL